MSIEYLRIAVIDDIPEDRRLIIDFLQTTDSHTVFFEGASVEHALALRILPDGRPPDAMILDFHLVGGTGLEVLRELALETGTLPFPVILITADSEKNPDSALKMGAHDFIRKSELTPAVLGRVLRNSVTRFRLEEDARRNDLRLRSVLSDAPIPIMVHAADGRVIELSQTFTAITGYTREDIPTHRDWMEKAFGIESQSVTQRSLDGNIPALGTNYRRETTIRTKFGAERCWLYFESNPRALSDGSDTLISMALDITDRREAEHNLRNRVQSLELLNALSNDVARAKALPEIYEAAMRVVTEAAGADRAALLLFDSSGVMRFEASKGLSENYLRTIEGHSPWNLDQQRARPILIEDIFQDASMNDFQAVFAEEGIRALAFIPLIYEDRLLGKFMLYFNTPHRISEEALKLVQTAANQVAVAIERKLSEQALKRSEARYRDLVESLDGVVFEKNLHNPAFTFLSPRVETILGYPSSTLRESPELWFNRLVYVEDRNKLENLYQRCSENLFGYEVEFRVFHNKGHMLWLREIGSPVLDEEGCFAGFRGIMLDITRHKEAQESLKQSEERLRQVVLGSPNPMVVYAEDGEILHMSRTWSGFTGYHLHEMPTKQAWLQLGFGDRWAHRWDSIQKAFANTVDSEGKEEEIQTRSGEIRNWVISEVPLGKLPDGRRIRASAAMDITERKKYEAKLESILYRLQETHALLDTLFENAPVGLGFWDSQVRFARVNQALSEITGLPATSHLGRTVAELFPNLDSQIHSNLQRVLETGSAIVAREVLGETPAAPGLMRYFLMSFYPVRLKGRIAGVGAVCEDITERRGTEIALQESEEKLRHSQKMEAIGRLAGGVAHDFNNLLTAINGYSELGLALIEKNHPVRENLEEIHRAGERAASLTRQLLAYSRKQLLTPRILDLNLVLSGMEGMLRRLIGEHLNLQMHLSPHLGSVKADPAQIEQIVLNLAINARDAMPMGGELHIETAEADLDEVYSHYLLAVQPGKHARISVSDTGMGMSPEVRQRIFDPFFTTKEQGKGTGLGLSSVYGSVEQSGGNISVESREGEGTRFDIFFPIAEPEENLGRSTAFLPLSFFQSGQGKILLVEDEDAVRSFILKVLELKGYTVIQASNAGHALEIAGGKPIDLLLTDVVMPGMNGPTLAKRLLMDRPGLKVIYMSGYTSDITLTHGLHADEAEFLQKPFNQSQLLQKVQAVLLDAVDKPEVRNLN